MVTDLLILTQVLLIDVTLAGDNAVVVALAVLGLPARERRLAILFGIAAATIIRILFALLALRLLQIIGLTLAGGLLLLWVCWRMMREFSGQARLPAGEAAVGVPARPGHLRRVVLRIVLADLSMSLDNVLAVAGAAKQHAWILVTGLAVSVLLMGAAASLVARLLERYRWIAWIGLLIVLAVAIELIIKGSGEVLRDVPLLRNVPRLRHMMHHAE